MLWNSSIDYQLCQIKRDKSYKIPALGSAVQKAISLNPGLTQIGKQILQQLQLRNIFFPETSKRSTRRFLLSCFETNGHLQSMNQN